MCNSRVKEKYEREIKELEKQESETKEKYIESKGRLAECEANITNLQATVKQLDTQLTHFKKVNFSLCNQNCMILLHIFRKGANHKSFVMHL